MRGTEQSPAPWVQNPLQACQLLDASACHIHLPLMSSDAQCLDICSMQGCHGPESLHTTEKGSGDARDPGQKTKRPGSRPQPAGGHEERAGHLCHLAGLGNSKSLTGATAMLVTISCTHRPSGGSGGSADFTCPGQAQPWNPALPTGPVCSQHTLCATEEGEAGVGRSRAVMEKAELWIVALLCHGPGLNCWS